MKLTIRIARFSNPRQTEVGLWNGPLYLRFASHLFDGRMEADIYAADLATEIVESGIGTVEFKVYDFTEIWGR